MKQKYPFLCCLFFCLSSIAQQKVPSSYSNIHYDNTGSLFFQKGTERYYADTAKPLYSIATMVGSPTAISKGLQFDFGSLKGTITYGLIPYGKSTNPLPVFRLSSTLQNGKAFIDIKKSFPNAYEMTGMNESTGLSFGYRLQDEKGIMLYDGVVSVKGTGPFTIVPAIYEGPFVSNITDSSTVIWFETTMPVKASVSVNEAKFSDPSEVTHHEIIITGLQAATDYKYIVQYGVLSQSYSFKTAPLPGTRKAFVFAFTSDCREAAGGGERNIYGTNAYIMKKMAAVAYQNNAAFLQFTGDMVSGYKTNKEDLLLQLTNWKKSVEPFWHSMPFYVGQGNHESVEYLFRNTSGTSSS